MRNDRNDNTTNLAYVGSGDGKTPPEQYYAYDPTNLADATPIQPGETTILRNAQTGLYCRLVLLPTSTAQCPAQGMVCDQGSPSAATIMTYTGSGLSYGGTPLVQQPVTNTLILSSEPACSVPNGAQMSFPPATGGMMRLFLHVRSWTPLLRMLQP